MSGPRVALLAGLPGVGKTTLARAARTGAEVLSRNEMRDAIFPDRFRDYGTEQNEVATAALYGVLDHVLRHHAPALVIVDGKPFSRREEIAAARRVVAAAGGELPLARTLEIVEARLRAGLAGPDNVRAELTPREGGAHPPELRSDRRASHHARHDRSRRGAGESLSWRPGA